MRPVTRIGITTLLPPGIEGGPHVPLRLFWSLFITPFRTFLSSSFYPRALFEVTRQSVAPPFTILGTRRLFRPTRRTRSRMPSSVLLLGCNRGYILPIGFSSLIISLLFFLFFNKSVLVFLRADSPLPLVFHRPRITNTQPPHWTVLDAVSQFEEVLDTFAASFDFYRHFAIHFCLNCQATAPNIPRPSLDQPRVTSFSRVSRFKITATPPRIKAFSPCTSFPTQFF